MKLRLIDLITLYCITTYEPTAARPFPTHAYLTGVGPTWNGAINQYLKRHQVSMFDAQPVRSSATFQHVLNRLRAAGLLVATGNKIHAIPTDDAILLFQRLGSHWTSWRRYLEETCHDTPAHLA